MEWSLDDSGWVKGIEAIHSPNFNARPKGAQIDLLVIHAISLPPGEFGSQDITRLFLNQLDFSAHPDYASLKGLEVSAHFLIRRNGACIQYVSCLDRAWHAGVSSWRGRENCNDFSLGIELEGSHELAFTEQQYQSLIKLKGLLMASYPIQEVLGHEHIAPGRKQDPGPYFDWQRIGKNG